MEIADLQTKDEQTTLQSQDRGASKQAIRRPGMLHLLLALAGACVLLSR